MANRMIPSYSKSFTLNTGGDTWDRESYRKDKIAKITARPVALIWRYRSELVDMTIQEKPEWNLPMIEAMDEFGLSQLDTLLSKIEEDAKDF